MKLLLTSAFFLTNCVLAQPSSYNEETCEIDWIVELQLRFMFGTNIDIGDLLTVDIFTRNYERLELVYLAYHDNFRRLLRDSHGNFRNNWVSRLDYYHERLRLATEEVNIEARTGHQRCDQYMAHVPTRSITLSVPCGSSIGCSCGGANKLYQQDCTNSIDLYRYSKCVTYTVRVPESPEEVGAARTLITLTNRSLLHGIISQLYEARNRHRPNGSAETLRTRLRRFFRLMHIVRIRRRVRMQTEFRRYDHDLGMLDVNVDRMISDDEYFAETMRRPEMWFDDDADELEMVLQSHIAQASSSGSDSSSQHSPNIDIEETFQNISEGTMVRPEMLINDEATADEVEILLQDHNIQGSSRNYNQQLHNSETFGNSENSMLHRFLAQTYNRCSEIQGLLRQNGVEMSHFERALYGLDNSNSRQCRPLTENELRNLHNGTAQGSGKTKRSIPGDEKSAKIGKLNTVVRQRLMDFTLVSIMNQMEANYLNKSLEWSKDFKDLYNQYLNGNWTNVLCENSSLGFDNFLYSRLHRNPNWEKCIGDNVVKDKRCYAMRRILKETDSKNKNSWLDESARSEQFLKDQVKVYKELNKNLEPTTVINNDVYESDEIYLNSDINLFSIFLTFAQINPCV